MKTIRRMIYSEVLRAVGVVTLAFLLLFFGFDLIDELQNITDPRLMRGYTLPVALLKVALEVPGHLYELLPIAVLIGTIYVMARLAESSEYTILRTSGLGPRRALLMLLTLGLGFVALTFVVGDYAAPAANHAAQMLKARFLGDITTGHTGAWLKERQDNMAYSINVGALNAQGDMSNVRIFGFDARTGRLLVTLRAPSARFAPDDGWDLQQPERKRFPAETDVSANAGANADSNASASRPDPRVIIDRPANLHWPTSLSQGMVAAAVLDPDGMQTLELFQYVRHLQTNGQNAQRYQIAFWRKVFYPLSCLVMLVLALPFAYLHFRAGNIAGYVFLGVLAGISFFLLNNLSGFIGNLRSWEPWLAAAAPGILYSILSLGAFTWLVLRQ
ncbi:MAG: LPS export ABC transporter permease LptG [Burkholderiaceae bacterium]|jgi:lipopolysaccharide export system permease protein|nr:LPS export ABC transporter permease LptG [Burkholderiaceae bacterium]